MKRSGRKAARSCGRQFTGETEDLPIPAGAGGREVQDTLDEGSLACAIDAGQAERASCGDLETHVPERVDLPETLADTLQPDGGGAAGGRSDVVKMAHYSAARAGRPRGRLPAKMRVCPVPPRSCPQSSPSSPSGSFVRLSQPHRRVGSADLSGVDLKVRRGQLVALMGGSGSGKTTVLRLLGGQVAPAGRPGERGWSRRARPDQRGLYQLRRRMGMLFQFGALFTDMSVFENVAFPLREHTTLPETAIRDPVLMKPMPWAARRPCADAVADLGRHVAPRRAGARHRARSAADHVRRTFAGLDPISRASRPT